MIRRLMLIFFALSIAIVPLSAQDDLTEQNFLMTFIPNIQFSPMYVAMEQGSFADEGYTITLDYLNEPDVVDLIAAEQEQFGIVSGEQVILSRAQERTVVYVYEWFQQYPIGIVVPSGTDITTAQDLAGLKVGIPGRFGATYSGFTTLLMASDMAESDVQLEEIGFNAPDVFCLGAIDASVIYVNNEPLQINNLAEQGDCADVAGVEVIYISEIVDLVSNGIITSEALIESDPELVAAMTRAFDAGLQTSINNPARAYLLSLPYVESLPADDDFVSALTMLADAQDTFLAENPDRQAISESRIAMRTQLGEQFDNDMLIQFDVLLQSIELWDADQLGLTEDTSWTTMQDTLLAMGLLEESIPLDTAYSNDFLPE